jgi:hypothetical protein
VTSNKRYISPKEASKICGFSVRSIRKSALMGLIRLKSKGLFIQNQRILLLRSDIEAIRKRKYILGRDTGDRIVGWTIDRKKISL